ncbi:MAG: hypothetical protein H7Z73_08035 [Candidatus Saccharibacteria bacterium]|nr:hypothetical protein [Moraxellaceae bacterium]
MRKSLQLNSRALFTKLGLSTVLCLAISCSYANSNNTSTYSDAVFAANAVKAPVAQDDDDNYNYRGRYAQMSAEKQQLQKIAEEQKAHDAQVSSIPRLNESHAEYQARMEKEHNPVWLKHQAQAKLQAQIIAQQEAKKNQKPVGIASSPVRSVLPNNNLNKTEAADQTMTTDELSALRFSPTHPPEISPDSIPREMSMGKYITYSLFYLVGIVWSVIFFVGLMRRRNQ